MKRLFLSLLLILFTAATAHATAYEISVKSPDGTDTADCGQETACAGTVPLAGHKPIQFTMEYSGGMLVLTFFQDGYHLPVHPAGNSLGSAKGTFVVKADTVGAGAIIPLTAYAPDAGNLTPKANDPDPKTAPIALEATIRLVAP